MAANVETFEERSVRDERRPTVDAQGVVASRNDEDQPDIGVLKDVEEAVASTIARALRDDERVLIEHQETARGVPLGRHVAASPAIAGRHEDIGGCGDPRNVTLVESVPDLVAHSLDRVSENLSQLVEGPDLFSRSHLLVTPVRSQY
jgi:hypothetical protein